MIKHLRVISMAVGLVFACRAMAQTVAIPYHMSFEASEAAELQNWVMNKGGASCVDQWMVGSGQASEGTQSLFISDNDSTAHYGIGSNVQFAYRDFLLPPGSYSISFDWKNYGSANSALFVGWAPASTKNLTCDAIKSSGALITPYTYYYPPSLSNPYLYSQRYWQNLSFSVGVNGTTTYRLFFAWCSSNADTVRNPIGACIDNLEIRPDNCPKPTGITADLTCKQSVITVTGLDNQYEVGYRRVGETYWHSRSISASGEIGGGIGTLLVENLEEGMYDFRARTLCGNDETGRDTSAYLYLNSQVLFCPEAHCINYVDLHDTTGTVVCLTGEVGSSGVLNPLSKLQQVVDYGSSPEENTNWHRSRHTTCWDIDAYDACTNYKLPLIPEGELASVKLGNWHDDSQWESVVYNYLVDSVYSVLLLKYAVILEDPDHDIAAQPRFTLNIKDANGLEVDATCGSADFHAGQNSGNKGSGWHQETIQHPDPSYTSTTVVTWKEWTTYGINLTPYIGQTLQIIVATNDCAYGAHFGYGYFTLGCAKAKIEGVSCGDDAKMDAEAPEGFLYEWTKKIDDPDNPANVVSHDRTLQVEASDTATYRCRLIYKDQADCYFDLYSSVLPRFPVAALSYTYKPIECENRVQFTNLSHIMTKYEGDTLGTHHYDEPCDDFEWVIGNDRYSENNPTVVFPQEGGTFPVTLFASISEGRCTDDTTFNVVIPKIGNEYVSITDSICYGSYVTFGSKNVRNLNTSGVYVDSTDSRAGCDSITTLTLTVFPEIETKHVIDSTCAGTPYVVDGDVYPYGDSTGIWPRKLKSSRGCDSTVVMHITVYPMLEPTMARTMPYVCAPDTNELATMIFPMSIVTDTSLVSITLFPSEEAQEAGFESSYLFNRAELDFSSGKDTLSIPIEWSPIKKWIPGTYKFDVVFKSKHGCDVTITTNVELRHGFYAVNQIYGFMFVQNTSLNGGFDFDSFQWYKNGEKIPGANSYYIELSDADSASVFYCMVSYSAGDTVSTCPIYYDWSTTDKDSLVIDWEDENRSKTDLETIPTKLFCVPTLAQPGSEVRVSTEEELQVYDLLCRKVASYPPLRGAQQIIIAPQVPGMYIVRSKSGATAHIIVK